MLSIRLSRVGKKNKPQYRVILQEKTRRPSSRILEQLGTYNPHTEPRTINFNQERVKYWLSKGAKASPTVFNMLVDLKLVQGNKITLGNPKKKKSDAAEAKEQPAVKKEEPAAKAE